QVSLWDALRGQRSQLLQSDSPLSSIAWSPDGQRLATSHVTGRREVDIWDVNSGSVQKSLHVPEVAGGSTCGLAWLPDGGRLLVGCFTSLELWDIESDKSLHSVPAAYQFNWLNLSPDGTQVLMPGPTGKSLLWRIESDRLVGPQEMATALPAPTAFSLVGGVEDAVWSVFNSNQGIVRGNPSTGDATRVTKEPLNPVALSTHDGQLIAYEAGGAIGVLDAASGHILWSIAEHGPQAGPLSWSPDGSTLAIQYGYLHCRLQLFSTASGQSEWQPDSVRGCNGPRSIAWSPGGDMLFGFCEDGFRVWDYRSKSLLGMFPIPWSADTMALSPDGKILVTNAIPAGGESGLHQGKVRLWEVSSRKELGELALSNNQLWPLSIELSPDGSLLAVGTMPLDGGINGGLELLAVESGKVLWAITPGTGAAPLAFSPDGKLLASPSSIYDAETGERLTDFHGQSNPTTVRWLRDGKTIVTGAGDKTLRYWDAATGISQRVVPAPMCAVLSPDESLAAGVCVRWRNPAENTGTVQISDARTGRLLRSIVGLRDGKYLTLAPDGHYVATPKIERDIVYVVETDAGQETLTPEEFSQRFGWQNDPTQVRLAQ
ncbi:MAG: hypothetical protein FJ276_34855, partial [Planctomycetes bacterium]|nr:hypothetical protein [Planctomycetota bacterium]